MSTELSNGGSNGGTNGGSGPKRNTVWRTLIADDDPLARHVIRRPFDEADDFEVVAEASTGAEAVAAAHAQRPNLVLLDVQMPELDGIAAARRIGRLLPEARIVMLAARSDDELALLSIRAGASGYLSKSSNISGLPRVMRCVMAGEAGISRSVASRLTEWFRDSGDSTPGMRPVRSPLTPREWEVLDLLRAGESTSAIAGELEMAVETVRSHVKSILRKLGVHSRREAVRIANGLQRVDGDNQGHSQQPEAIAAGV